MLSVEGTGPLSGGVTTQADFDSHLVRALNLEKGIICLTGAGGKKTLMRHLALAYPGRLALSTTVHMLPLDPDITELILAPSSLKSSIRTCAQSSVRVVGFVQDCKGEDWQTGLTPEQVMQVYETANVDACLIKADGARRKLIKAPAEYEPVLPEKVDLLVPIVSARVFGKVLTNKIAHRPDRLAKIIAVDEGVCLEPVHIARLLTHAEGSLKGHSQSHRVIPNINMVDDDGLKSLAIEAAEMALDMTEHFDRVLLTSFKGSGYLQVIQR